MTAPNWTNTRFQRLLAWGLWRHSPSLGRAPTFREAWTGVIVNWLTPDQVAHFNAAFRRAFGSEPS